MAKVWFVREGKSPIVGDPAAEKSLEWCIKNLPCTNMKWIAPLDRPPQFGKSTDLDAVRGAQYVVVEVENIDGQKKRPGFYLLLGLSIAEAKRRLEDH